MRNVSSVIGALTFALFCHLYAASAATISFTGSFTADDNIQLFNFSISSPGTVTIQSWGFAGGTNGAGQVIPAGGFATDLSLFDASGNLITSDFGGTAPGCAPRNIDPITTFCLDAYINTFLADGQYIVALTEDNNLPFGPTLADGFLQQGQGNFTGPAVGQQDGSFLLITGDQRTNQWAVDIGSVDSAQIPSTVPEPSRTVPVILLLLSLAAAGRWNAIARTGEPR
jgi:hypothetical protein